MKQYLSLLAEMIDKGDTREDRTGVGTHSLFGRQLRFDLAKGFPLLTTKRVSFKALVYELLWFMRGDTNIDYLRQHQVSIWDEWADENGDLGPIYGKQWRSWATADGRTVDQLNDIITQIQEDATSRRLIVSAWNVGDLEHMRLPPCHILFQFYVSQGKLSCQLYQRSADMFLGVPFNIASYSLLTMMMAQVCGLQCGEFVHTFGDVHLYTNHIQQACTQLRRKPRSLPKVKLNPKVQDLFAFQYEDIELLNYNPAPTISAPVAV